MDSTIARSSFDQDKLLAELTTDEGNRLMPYVDTVGKVSIGIGRNLTDRGLTQAEVNVLFATDVQLTTAIMDREIPWWRNLTPKRQRVMLNLCWMGWGSFSQFRRFLTAMQSADWNTAEAELRNSKWWQQVGTRGPRLVQRLHDTNQS